MLAWNRFTEAVDWPSTVSSAKFCTLRQPRLLNLPETGNVLGFLAAGLVLVTFAMRSMLPLRLVGIAGNLAFITYGVYQELIPVVLLHALLLPLNVWRAIEIAGLVRRIRHARQKGMDISSLLPLMSQANMPLGHSLFSKGDHADCMYLVVDGTVSIPEHQVEIGTGALVGEMGFFDPERRRTASAVCSSECRIASLSYREMERIFFQEPGFGLALMGLMVSRFVRNEQRLRNRSES